MHSFALVTLTIISASFANDVETYASTRHTLKTLHVIFRHGDRTPSGLYPNDPYTGDSFYPIRLGELTNKGKRTEFNIGTTLRSRYGTFLPKIYTPEIVYAISSHLSRTKASLQLVLAGLFPPADILKWNDDLLWQPIPYDYFRKEENKIFMPSIACPRYSEYENVSFFESRADPIAIKYQDVGPFLQEVSGYEETNIFKNAFNLYSTLKSEDECGLSLPAWSEAVYPDILSELSAHSWKYYTGIGNVKTLQSGFLVSQIVNNTISMINGVSSAKNRKIHLYSGHDFNIAALLFFLNSFKPHNPPYGSYIIIEVHTILGIHHLKFSYESYECAKPVMLVVPKCGIYCPLDLFIRLYANEIDSTRLDLLCG